MPKISKVPRLPLPVPERLRYSIPETSQLLGISYRSVWRKVSDGELTLIRDGGRVFIGRADLERAALADKPLPGGQRMSDPGLAALAAKRAAAAERAARKAAAADRKSQSASKHSRGGSKTPKADRRAAIAP